jgi:hypothetical protein
MRFQNRPTEQRMNTSAPRERAPTRDRPINTKVVGVKPVGTPENEATAQQRQNVLEYISRVGEPAFDGTPPEYWLKLTEEPTNPYDNDAVRVMLHSRTAQAHGRVEGVQVGYIANGERICTGCGKEFDRPKTSDQAILVCDACGHPTKRDGLASQLKARAAEAGRSVEEHYNVTIAWDAGGITGGGLRTHGCNIRIQARA